jgi:KDO2-lipid IV(A) palmitoleoyltransferase
MEWVQTRGRMRSNKAMISRNNLRGMVGALKKGEAVWFAPDQDYGRKGSSFAPFFAVKDVATTNGTFVISRLSGAAMLTVTMVRKADKSGYRLHISPEMANYPENECEAAAFINKVIEKRSCVRLSNICGCTAVSKRARLAKPRSISKFQKVSFAKKLTFSITCNYAE